MTDSSRQDSVQSDRQPDRPSDRQPDPGRSRWAPWWIYLVVVLGGNYLRQALVPFGTVPQVVDVLLAVAVAGVLFVVVTVAHRALARRR